jgi:hypothetical protein
MVYSVAIAQLEKGGPSMNVYIVWKGDRDYEENVAACATEELAEGVLAEFGVTMRSEPGWPDRSSLMDAAMTPWGIEECEWRGAMPTGSGAKARATDPGTSKAAAAHAKPRAGSQRQRLYIAVRAAGPRGMTAEEAAKATAIRLNSASTRMSELVRGDWLAESQGGTRKTSGGEQAIVYVAKREMADYMIEVVDPRYPAHGNDESFPCMTAGDAALRLEDLTADADADEVEELLASGDPAHDLMTWTDDETGVVVTLRRLREGG